MSTQDSERDLLKEALLRPKPGEPAPEILQQKAQKYKAEQRAIAALIAHTEAPHGYQEYYAALWQAQNTAAGLMGILSTQGKRAFDAAARSATAHYAELAARLPEGYQRAELTRIARFEPRRNTEADRADTNNTINALAFAVEQYRRAGMSTYISGAMIGVLASLELGRVTDAIYTLLANEAAGLVADHYREGMPLNTPQQMAARSIWHDTPAAVPVALLTIQRAQMYYPETDDCGDIIRLNPITELHPRP